MNIIVCDNIETNYFSHKKDFTNSKPPQSNNVDSIQKSRYKKVTLDLE
jgi:hypothetical protein